MRGSRLFRLIDRYIGIPLCFILGLFDKVFHQSPVTSHQLPARILAIKLSAIGDTILLIPSLRALKEAYPGARIGAVVTSINRAIVEDCPYVDEIFPFEAVKSLKNPWHFFRFILRLRRQKFEFALDFDQWVRISSIIAYLSGANQRGGFVTPGQHKHYLFTKPTIRRNKRHEVESFLDVIRDLGVKERSKSLELWIGDKERASIRHLLGKNGVNEGETIIGIHPGRGTHGYPRQWKEENYSIIADTLMDECGAKVVFTGNRDDLGLIGRITSSMKRSPINMAGKTSLREFMALIERCSLLLCVNTGAMHIAAALKTPVVALHGPDDPAKWGPWGEGHTVIRAELPCSPCSYLGFEYGCKKHTCMDLISVEDVLEAIRGQATFFNLRKK